MFHLHRIDSLDLPELSPYRTLKRPANHQAQGIFVAESEKVVRRLLASRFPVVSVLLPEKWLAPFEPLLQARPENIPVYVVEKKETLEALIGFTMFQGVMAVGKIPAPVSLEEVLAETPPPRLFVAVDALANAENLGVLVRNCAAFGVQALLVGETSSSPFLRRAVRNSMGAVFHLPVVEPPTLAHALRELRAQDIHCVAAHPAASGKTLAQAGLTGDCCLVFGSEGYGISPKVLAACDEAVAIPMPPNVDSLNVASAAAVFLYEVNRQRGKM
ncbi:MAG: RNA methyltransferase [Verrucomicrobiae bacterium]|nr:RNA methyltransferase [Verrucomicrobiae bacterium]